MSAGFKVNSTVLGKPLSVRSTSSKNSVKERMLTLLPIPAKPPAAPAFFRSLLLVKRSVEKVCEEYEILAKDMLRREREGKPITFYHYMLDLESGPCVYKRISGCGSGTEYMAVTPWGDLYPCHQFVGEEKFKLGDIWNGVSNTEIQQEFMDCNV